jgi:hypothetical protein
MSKAILPERTDVADDGASLIAHPLIRESGGNCGELEALVRIMCDEVQLLESVAHDCITGRLLSSAVGVQLDQWGSRVGLPRLGLGDEDYRKRIRTWLMCLYSDGRVELICEIVQRLTGAATIRYTQSGTAHFVLEYVLAAPTDATQRWMVNEALLLATPAGVSWTVVEGDIDGWFGFSEDTDPLSKGFDEGGLSEVVSQVNQ